MVCAKGLWPANVNIIPLQRPESLGERNVLTDEELAARDKTESQEVALHHWMEYTPSSQASLIVDPNNGRLPPMTLEAAKRNREMRDGLGPPSLAGVERQANSCYGQRPERRARRSKGRRCPRSR